MLEKIIHTMTFSNILFEKKIPGEIYKPSMYPSLIINYVSSIVLDAKKT